MKKCLLTLMFGLTGLASAVAANVGDYVYTATNRYKVIGANLVTNGSFAQNTTGWTTFNGNQMDAEKWALNLEAGPEGQNTIQSTNPDANEMAQSIPLEGGKVYVVSYQAKALVTTTTTSKMGNFCYAEAYTNATGGFSKSDAGYRSVIGAVAYNTGWTTITDTIVCNNPEYLQIVFQNIREGVELTNFTVNEVTQISDDRELDKVVAYANSLLANSSFTNGREDLEAAIAMLEELRSEESESVINDIISSFRNESIKNFLDANTVDMTSRVPNASFDEINMTNMLKTNGKIGVWNTTGGRYITRAASSPFETKYLERSTTAISPLGEGTVSQKIDVPEGKYMLSVDLLAKVYYYSKTTPYVVNPDSSFAGIRLVANHDTTLCQPIFSSKLNTYTVYTDVNAGDSLSICVLMPKDVGHMVCMDNFQLRKIGGTAEDVEAYYVAKSFAVSKDNLNAAIENATTNMNNSRYFYGKDSLNIAIRLATQIRDTATVAASLDAGRDSLNTSLNVYYKINKLYRTLYDDIAIAEEKLADNTMPNGRSALAEALDHAKMFIAGLSPDPTDKVADDQATLAEGQALEAALTAFVLANTETADEAYPFALWYRESTAPSYVSQLAADAVVTSGNASLYVDNGLFAEHTLNSRFAYLNNGITTEANQYGLQVYYATKNKTVLSILNLTAGDQVTIDWSMANTSHSVYISSGNATTTYTTGETVAFTKLGSLAKVDSHKLLSDNAQGVGGSCRSVMTMTADGSLDFYFGSSATTMRIGYVSIKHADPTGVQAVDTSTTHHSAIYNINGQRMDGTRVSQLKKGIYIVNGKKLLVK